jgi:transposase
MRNMKEFMSKENPVRFIDAFVDHLDLNQIGFQVSEVKTEGRPAFKPNVFLKLYFYGYLNGLRSSRKLEKEAIRNVELHWLLGSLSPNYHSIADLRKTNPKAIKLPLNCLCCF